MVLLGFLVCIILCVATMCLKWSGHVVFELQDIDIRIDFLTFCISSGVLLGSILALYHFVLKIIRAPLAFVRQFLENRQKQSFQKGLIYYHYELYTKALSYFKSVPQSYGLFFKGLTLQKLKRFDEAKTAFTSSEQAFELYGIIEQSAKAEQFEYLKKAYDLLPESPWLHSKLLDAEWEIFENASNLDGFIDFSPYVVSEKRACMQSQIFWLLAKNAKARDRVDDYTSYLYKAWKTYKSNLFIVKELLGAQPSDAYKVAYKTLEEVQNPIIITWLLKDARYTIEGFCKAEELAQPYLDNPEFPKYLSDAAQKAGLVGLANKYASVNVKTL